MPAGMSWKDMYKLEHDQLRGEGYPVDDLPDGRDGSVPANHLAVPSAVGGDEGAWRAAYEALRARRALGIMPGYRYVEPDDLDAIFADADDPPALSPLSAHEYADRIRGAWFARCAAVILGKPLEMGWDRLQIRAYLMSLDAYPLSGWVPAWSEKLHKGTRTDCLPSTLGNVRYVQSDDDIHYTICSLLLAEKAGEAFTLRDAAENLLDNIAYHWVWTADRHLYSNLVNLPDPLDRSAYVGLADTLNPWRESMCPQLKADLWGYITPGEGRRGAAMIHRLGSLSATKNGLYGGMFMQGCVSAALSDGPSVARILEGGLSNIPRRSRLYEAIRSVIRWHGEMARWEDVCDRIYEAYGHWYFAGAINNLCFVTLALLEGALDFEKTIAVSVMCGTDTDCNSANAGSVVGAAIGYDKLPSKWIAPLNDDVRSCVAGFGFGRISELADRTVAVREKMMRHPVSV